MPIIPESLKKLTRADFVSDQEVRWCPGCGDYAILASLQKVMPELGIPRENIVFISGIGCSGRLPYYMNTYGFHTIHGRAPAVATGLKLTRPDLSVWIITGDGDALSIGGNHLLHILRRNVDVKILLFNNRIYGLTKGQYSPTSELGKISHTSPHGTVDRPLDPVTLALAAGATFVARGLDVDAGGLQKIFRAAAAHRGTAFVEIYQNCNIFNDGAFDEFAERSVRADRTVWLEEGQPLRFGAQQDKGLRLNGTQLEIVDLNGNTNGTNQLLVHDSNSAIQAYLLATMSFPQFPVPMGIFKQSTTLTYEDRVGQREKKVADQDVAALFRKAQVWQVDTISPLPTG